MGVTPHVDDRVTEEEEEEEVLVWMEGTKASLHLIANKVAINGDGVKGSNFIIIV